MNFNKNSMNFSKILVTGADGFIGKNLCAHLKESGYKVRGAVRSIKLFSIPHGDEIYEIGSIGASTDWSEALSGVQAVVHLVGLTHKINDSTLTLDDYMEINFKASIKLASKASDMGVRRFVFLSSVKAAGERSFDRPLREDDPPLPEDFYGISKLEAENGLFDLSLKTGMDLVVIRPPLVYGPGVKGNFLSLIDAVSKGVPLPLSGIKNKRSMVSVFNLVDFVAHAIKHEKAGGETFFVSDNHDISTPELVRSISKLLGKPARLFPIPLTILKNTAWLTGKSSVIEKLTGSLQVDIKKAVSLLGWKPPMGFNEGLKKTVSWYISR